MALILTILFLICNLGLIIGFFRPDWVLYKLNIPKTTGNALIVYGSLSLFTLVAFIIFNLYDDEDYRLAYNPDNSGFEDNLMTLPEKKFEMPDPETGNQKIEEKEEQSKEQISDELKNQIISKLKKIDETARAEAREMNPAGPGDFDNGDQLILIKRTNVKITKDNTGDVIEAGRNERLYPGSWVKFLNIENERRGSRYSVEVYAPDGRFYGTGWITDAELKKQWGNLNAERQMQDELAAELRAKGREQLLDKYDITSEELETIIREMK